MNRLRDRIWMRFRWPMSKGPFCFVTGSGDSFVFTLIGDKWVHDVETVLVNEGLEIIRKIPTCRRSKTDEA